MQSRPDPRAVLIVLGILLFSACSSPDGITGPPDQTASAGVSLVATCQLGCVDIDPSPDSAGIFIGQTSADQCTEGTDADADGLGDWCETRLAQAFAPELKYWSADNVGREPKWAARWLDETTVRVIYLLSYYRDEGSSAWVCAMPPIGPWYPTESCFGHNGDPEVVALDISYSYESSHWVLTSAHYSQHADWHDYGPEPTGYPSIQYPDRLGGYPRIWVSQGKHASYISQSACNAGGTLQTDTCVDVNTAARVSAGSVYNIGDRAHHTAAQDCWVSQDPSYQYYGAGRTECYWTPSLFRGWIPGTVGGRSAEEHYSGILDQQGF